MKNLLSLRRKIRLLPLLMILSACFSTRPVPAGAMPAAADWKLSEAQRTEVIELGKTLVEAIQAPDDATRRRLIRAAYAPEVLARVGIDPIAAQLARINGQFPGFLFHSAEVSEGRYGEEIRRALHVYGQQPGDVLWRDLQVTLSPVAPYHLDQLMFIAEISEPVYLPNGAIDSEETLEWLNAYIDGLVKEYDLSGSLLIAVGERVICERAFGFADAARTRPVTTETLFSMASAGKMFTALGIARLVESGKVSWDTTIDRFFPDFPDQEFARRVTLGHLLSHTSGIGEYWTEETADAVRNAESTADMLPLVYRAGVQFPPGTQCAYSNSNFILAGLIMEKVSGRSYETFLEDLIVKPLGLKNTGLFRTDDATRPIAVSLTRDGKGWTAAPRGVRGTAAGGCFSTPRDLLSFVRALRAGRIVTSATLAMMTASKTDRIPGSDMNYGYGFLLENGGGTASFGHGGIARGINAEVRCFPGPDITMIVLGNQDNGAYDDLRKNVTRLISGER